MQTFMSCGSFLEDMVKFKTVGMRCVADLLAEVIRASSIDLNSAVVEQLRSTGGWKSVYCFLNLFIIIIINPCYVTKEFIRLQI